MTATTAPPTLSPLHHLYLMSDPSLWLTWPFLPLMRRSPGKEEECGVLFDAQAVCGKTGYRCTVYLTNLFLLPATIDDLFTLPKEVFDTFEDVLAAGWQVD